MKKKIAYQQALKSSGYNYKMEYTEEKGKRNRRKRCRDICWFTPPFSSNVKTPVGELFLNAVDRIFHKDHDLHQRYNRNTMKISYRTTKNLKSHVDAHNSNILQPTKQETVTCNCKNKFKSECPLPGQCTVSNIVYQADVKAEGENYRHTDHNTVGKLQTYR